MFYASGWKRRFRLKPHSSLVQNHDMVYPDDNNFVPATGIDRQISIRGSSSESVNTTSSCTHSMAYTTESVKPVAKDFAYPDSPISPKTDSFSVWSDAAGEPLINDSKSDVIPRSVRPIDLHLLKANAEHNQLYAAYEDTLHENGTVSILTTISERPSTPETSVHRNTVSAR